MRTCKHCYMTFETAHNCEVAMREIEEGCDEDLTPLIPTSVEKLAAAFPVDVQSGMIDEV